MFSDKYDNAIVSKDCNIHCVGAFHTIQIFAADAAYTIFFHPYVLHTRQFFHYSVFFYRFLHKYSFIFFLFMLETFPYSSPKVLLEETKGLSDVQKDELKRELNAICEQRKGEVVIYDLTQAVQAFLHRHNKPPCGSFYDQMLIERNKRDEALEQQRAQRLNHEQQLIRDQVLKRTEILRNEDRWIRETRHSMSEQIPKHRSNSSGEMTDDINDRMNECELHLDTDDLYFPSVSRKIWRGSCLGVYSVHFSSDLQNMKHLFHFITHYSFLVANTNEQVIHKTDASLIRVSIQKMVNFCISQNGLLSIHNWNQNAQ